MNLLKLVYIILGTISLGVGIIGVFVPGLPTTMFLLLTAFFYMKGSERLYRKLINNKLIGKYIKDYQTRKGMTVRTKVYAITLMWFMITVSWVFFIKILWVDLTVIGVGIIGTIVMGFIVPTVREED